MKTKFLLLTLALVGLELSAQTPTGLPNMPARNRLPRYTAPATNGIVGATTQPRYVSPPSGNPGAPADGTGNPAAPTATAAATPLGGIVGQDEIAPMINFQGVEMNQVLEIYSQYVGRTLLRANIPDSKIILKTTTPLTRGETIQALQAVLALNNVSVINVGEKFVKVVPSDQANTAAGDIDRSGSTNLPILGSYVTHIVQLKYIKPSEMLPVITPFAKLANSILAIDSNGILVLRDYAENVKRMLEMIEQIDVSVPAEYISEVIPIRYAKVSDIAAALNSLGGGGGGASVSIGTAPSSGTISGFGGRSSGISGVGSGGGGAYGGSGGIGGGGGAGAFGARSTSVGGANPNGNPAGGSSFAQRLNNIINRASSPSGGGAGGGDQIQLFGQTKIIPNESSSTLLIYATRQDMTMIKEIIAKLDVPLAQVLIEAVIMNVTLGNTFALGVSAAQKPQEINSSFGGGVLGGGGLNNGQSFAGFVKTLASSNTVSTITSSLGTNGGSFVNSLPGGFSYFGNIGPNYDLAVTAAESDKHASIIQRPRIQTSQAKPAQFFVGNTVPYVTGNSYGGAYGNSSSYSQLSVGVELDVTPFINPDGEVSMDIQQEIDDLDGFTTITGVGQVPNTIKRTLNTSITVRNRDTVMIGGFIKSSKSTSRAGIPFLSSIPILGNLFSQRNDAKDREELIVLMRPTVLKTPKIAAENTIAESQRLPGVSRAISEDVQYEQSLVDAERKRELKAAKNGSNTNGFYNSLIPLEEPTNSEPARIAPVQNVPVQSAPAVGAPPATMNDRPTYNHTVNEHGASGLLKSQAPTTTKSAPAVSVDLSTPSSQQKRLDALLVDYASGKITADEMNAAREKIQDGGQ